MAARGSKMSITKEGVREFAQKEGLSNVSFGCYILIEALVYSAVEEMAKVSLERGRKTLMPDVVREFILVDRKKYRKALEDQSKWTSFTVMHAGEDN